MTFKNSQQLALWTEKMLSTVDQRMELPYKYFVFSRKYNLIQVMKITDN